MPRKKTATKKKDRRKVVRKKAATKKKVGGQPPYQPTERERQEVQSMAGLGMTQEEIALVLNLDPETIRKHFATDLKMGVVRANRQVVAATFRAASGAPLRTRILDRNGKVVGTEEREQPVNSVLNKWWTMNRLGWRGDSLAGATTPDKPTGVLLLPLLDQDECLTGVQDQQRRLTSAVSSLIKD